MCEYGQSQHPSEGSSAQQGPQVLDLEQLLPYARAIASEPEVRRSAAGFIGFGSTKAGDRVLLAVDTHYDPLVVEAAARALREKGAKVDIITVDVGPDREFDELDEVRAIIRRRPWIEEPRRWEGIPWIEELAERNKYDLLIHGKGGGPPPTPYRYECFPWLRKEHFASKATIYPREVHTLVNEKTWAMIWGKGKGGRVHLTDPEGTDLTYTLCEAYWEDGQRPEFSRRLFGPLPMWGHLMGHPSTPLVAQEDAEGVVAGTTSHFSRPFPHIKVYVEGSRVTRVEGGGKYGDAWREVLEESRHIQYPSFPGPGLFWIWEVAIGTNPKIVRPQNLHLLSSGGSEWERRRSGVIHVGFGTMWRAPEEQWAAERGLVYGHLHVHLLFPTMDLTTKEGETLRIIDRGRLTALDDPEVRQVASKYGDPDEMLKEDWVPSIPGINAPGSYEEYARDPALWIYSRR